MATQMSLFCCLSMVSLSTTEIWSVYIYACILIQHILCKLKCHQMITLHFFFQNHFSIISLQCHKHVVITSCYIQLIKLQRLSLLHKCDPIRAERDVVVQIKFLRKYDFSEISIHPREARLWLVVPQNLCISL